MKRRLGAMRDFSSPLLSWPATAGHPGFVALPLPENTRFISLKPEQHHLDRPQFAGDDMLGMGQFPG